MCGRFTLKTAPQAIAELFKLDAPPAELTPRYNVAPAQLIAVIGLKPDGKTRGLARLRWGFVPYWANDPDSGPKQINARAETVATMPPFDGSFREKRCLVPADGFYEWSSEGGKKVPHHFRLRGGGPFAFAGVWDVWKGEGRPALLTCAIITVPANALVKPFHDRMPAVLRPEDYAGWLEHDTPPAALLAMLTPFPADLMEAVRLAPVVNSVKNDGPECLTRPPDDGSATMHAQKVYGDADGPGTEITTADDGTPLPDLVGWECWCCATLFANRDEAERCCVLPDAVVEGGPG